MKITSHILDTARGIPAAGVRVRLLARRGESGAWAEIGAGVSDADGRVADLLAGDGGGGEIPAGECKLTFDTAAYQRKAGAPCFHPRVEIVFCVGGDLSRHPRSPLSGGGGGGGGDGGDAHYHIPLLLSPFGYTTYRGS